MGWFGVTISPARQGVVSYNVLQARRAAGTEQGKCHQSQEEKFPVPCVLFPYFILQPHTCPAILSLQLTASDLNSHIQNLFHTFALTQHLPNWVTDTAARQNSLANPWRRSQAFKEGTDMSQDTSWKKTPRWRKSSLITGNGTAADPVSLAEGSSQHGAAQLYSRTSSSSCSHATNLKSINPPCTESRGRAHLQGFEGSCQPLHPPHLCFEPQALQQMNGSNQG